MKMMVPRVRTTVDIFVTTPSGEATLVATQASVSHWFDAVIPHVHRLSPDGRSLLVADIKNRSLRLLDLSRGSTGAQGRTLSGALEWDKLRTLRWLDERRLVAHLENDVSLVSLSAGAFTATSILPEGLKPSRVEDARVLPSGVMIRHRAAGGERRVEYVGILNGHVAARHTLDTEGRRVLSANTLSAGRIVVALASTPELNQPAAIWVYRTHRAAQPSVIREAPCVDGCTVYNWTPGTARLVYALDTEKIVVETPDGGDMVLEMDEGGAINALWQNRAETRIAASNSRQLKVWDSHGTLLWSMRAKQGITSVHFAQDDQRLIVGDGDHLQLMGPFGQERALPWLAEQSVHYESSSLQFDDAIALPNGGFAFAVLRRARVRRR